MKKLIAIFIALLFVGCVGLSVKPDNNGITLLQKSAVSTVGYLVAKNNTKHIPDLLRWYDVFNGTKEFVDVQQAFKDGTGKLTALISDDPYLQLQINNAMAMLNISVDGPVIPEELDKYRDTVDLFMSGVKAVR